MQRNRETNSADEMRAKLPDAGALISVQRAATENATRMANAACHYALSVNHAWLELWDSHLDDYLELPKRFVNAQTDLHRASFRSLSGKYAETGQSCYKSHARSPVRGDGNPSGSRAIGAPVPIGYEGNGRQPSEREPDAWRRRAPWARAARRLLSSIPTRPGTHPAEPFSCPSPFSSLLVARRKIGTGCEAIFLNGPGMGRAAFRVTITAAPASE